MNQLQLSTDLNVITAEINSYKQVAGQAIFEIGRRLKHVKENDLVHGEWGEWCKSIEMTRGHADKFIKVYEEIGANGSSLSHLGVTALYEIATLPEDEREKEHTLSSGETKTVDEMTVRELQEVKRKLRESEEAKRIILSNSKEAKKRVEELNQEIESLKNQPPQVVKKEVIKEIVPDDLKNELDSTKRMLTFAEGKLKELEEYKKERELRKGEFDEEEAERERKKLMWEAERNVLTLKIKVDKFLEEVAITAFMEGAIATAGKSTKDKLLESAQMLKSFTDKIDAALKGRIEI